MGLTKIQLRSYPTWYQISKELTRPYFVGTTLTKSIMAYLYLFVYIQTSSKGYSLFPLKPNFFIQVCYLFCLELCSWITWHMWCLPLQLWKQCTWKEENTNCDMNCMHKNFLLHYIVQFSNRVLQNLIIMVGII